MDYFGSIFEYNAYFAIWIVSEGQTMAAKQEGLFPELKKARYGESRRTRPLFLPNYLKADSRDNRRPRQLANKIGPRVWARQKVTRPI